MVKVLVIFTCPFCNDGISNNIMNYFSYMDHNLIKADFLCNNSDVPQKWMDKIESFGGNLFIIKNRNRHPFIYIKKLIKIIRENKYDIVHAHGNSATLATEMYAAKKAGCKIRIAHSRNTSCTHKIADRLLRPAFNRLYTVGFACSDLAGRWLFKNRPYTVIKNGNDIEKFKFNLESRIKVRNELGIDETAKLILNVGILTKQKNQKYLLKIMNNEKIKNYNYKLLIVGKGELKEELNNIISIYGLENKVLFLQDRNDVNEIMCAADIYAFPSLYEGLPNALVEAQISGLFCLASNTITTEANVSQKVEFLSIDENNIDMWVNRITCFNSSIMERISNQQEIIDNVQKSGFDIRVNAKCLEQKYFSLKGELK